MLLEFPAKSQVDLVAVLFSCLTFITGYRGVTSSGSTEDVNKHLEMGRIHLENRQFADALNHYHAAIEGDPTNYQTYYKRALVFLALGKYNQALKDFDKVIDLKEDFVAAILQRANLLLKQGKLSEAHVDYERVLRRDPENPEAHQGYITTEETRRDYEEARYYVDIQDCHTAIGLLSRLIEVSPWDSELRSMRSECYMDLGDATHAVMDLRFTTKLNNDDTDGLYRLSSIQYQLGDVEEALREIRECLKLDPEHKHCFPLYKTLKKLDKLTQEAEKAGEQQDFVECIDDVKKALKVDKHLPQLVECKLRHKLCWCHLHNNDGSLAVDHCGKALEIRETIDILCDRAEAYLLDDMFSEAMEDYKRALDIDENDKRAREGMQQAQRRQKQSSKRDYYKILGVTRSATKREITKAYRKLAQKWHPDNYPEGNDKKDAQKKFIDIAAAKEVLTDPEKRAKFDQGEDPLDPEEQNSHHHGFHPFTHFTFSQGGFGQGFHFKFN